MHFSVVLNRLLFSINEKAVHRGENRRLLYLKITYFSTSVATIINDLAGLLGLLKKIRSLSNHDGSCPISFVKSVFKFRKKYLSCVHVLHKT